MVYGQEILIGPGHPKEANRRRPPAGAPLGEQPALPPLSLDRALASEGAVEGVGEVAGEVPGAV